MLSWLRHVTHTLARSGGRAHANVKAYPHLSGRLAFADSQLCLGARDSVRPYVRFPQVTGHRLLGHPERASHSNGVQLT